jgi:hypothetical protein
MAEFNINQDVETSESSVEVTITDGNELAVGRHRFRLVVVDNHGNRSVPSTVTVIVADTQAPTAVLDVESPVNFGDSFVLDGRRSFDAGGGRVENYVWTYLGPERG